MAISKCPTQKQLNGIFVYLLHHIASFGNYLILLEFCLYIIVSDILFL